MSGQRSCKNADNRQHTNIAPPSQMLCNVSNYRDIMYKAFADRYAGGPARWENDVGLQTSTKRLLDNLAKPAARVLDLGTGSGAHAETLLMAHHQVTAIDIIAHPHWEQIKHRWGAAVSFVTTAFLEWAPHTVARFDGILDNGCFHHQHPAHYLPYLEQVTALLAPDGRLVLTVFTPRQLSQPGFLESRPNDRLLRNFAQEEISALLRAVGLTVFRHERYTVPHRQRPYLIIEARKIELHD